MSNELLITDVDTTNSDTVDSILSDIENNVNELDNEEILSSILAKAPKKAKVAKVKKAKIEKISVAKIEKVEPKIEAKVEQPKVKITIDLSQISLPEGVSVKVNKNSNLYSKDAKRLVILGVKNIYFNSVISDLDTRLQILTAEEIKKAHLGSMRAKLSGIKDNNDFQTIINNYFKA